jgi:hypothetical protein
VHVTGHVFLFVRAVGHAIVLFCRVVCSCVYLMIFNLFLVLILLWCVCVYIYIYIYILVWIFFLLNLLQKMQGEVVFFESDRANYKAS